MFSQAGAFVDGQVRKHLDTPLSYAADNGHVAAVAWLIAANADIEENGEASILYRDCTVFFLPGSTGHVAVVQRLLAAGADRNAVSSQYIGLPCFANNSKNNELNTTGI